MEVARSLLVMAALVLVVLLPDLVVFSDELSKNDFVCATKRGDWMFILKCVMEPSRSVERQMMKRTDYGTE
ncbi:hypothetical protein L1987_23472 [Smallanthus sonchifolius]|uniref:Uncharacterized protein n=1 Tax=Smallanthus sonchifolius TaxID=185202 RepID=A0ACB9IIB0_9ASTR|nr:hypothetical protein L1987_23472 [Smallanthus sonchifolius]